LRGPYGAIVGLGLTEIVDEIDVEDVMDTVSDTDDDGDGTSEGECVADCEVEGNGSFTPVITAVSGGVGTQGLIGAVAWPQKSVKV
jgi:hypothetical protein